MTMAHVRGLLRPDYPYGIRSWLREKMVLNHLQLETQGQGFMAKAIIEAATLPVSSPETRPKTFMQSLGYLAQGVALLQGTPYDLILRNDSVSKTQRSIEQTAALFKMLKKTNFYDRMAKVMRENRK